MWLYGSGGGCVCVRDNMCSSSVQQRASMLVSKCLMTSALAAACVIADFDVGTRPHVFKVCVCGGGGQLARLLPMPPYEPA